MEIKQLISTYADALTERFGHRLLPGHRRALDTMLACRSQCGECLVSCDHCGMHSALPLSCGHRSCPRCQHHLGEAWLERQQHKLLPVTYLMVTFTLPFELREIAWQQQSLVYDLLFKAAIEALQTVGKNNWGLTLGMSGVLHTHTRRKDYHPHVHIILPAGGVLPGDEGPTWQSLSHAFLINEFALARVFRGIFLRRLFEQAIELPSGIPSEWVTHIRKVGRGKTAFRYLARYLYRGVISENDILTDREGQVTFRYQDSKTRAMKTRTQPATQFLWSLLKHVLPRGFRRVRDYGFLHANAKKTLLAIQRLLGVNPSREPSPPKVIPCQRCGQPAVIEWVLPQKIPMRFLFYTRAEKVIGGPTMTS